MNVSATTAAPSGIPPGLPADLAGAMLWFMAKLVRLMGWRLVGHRRAACAVDMHHYLMRGTRRFLRVLERLAAGEVFRKRPSRAGQVLPARATPRVRLPMEYGWVARLGEDVRMAAAMIGHHLNRTEVAALVAACPQAQRVMRPICHLLAIDAPCVGRVVRRKRVRRRAVQAPSPLSCSASQPKPARAGGGGEAGKPRRLTRKEREAILWCPNLEGKPMALLPRKLPRD